MKRDMVKGILSHLPVLNPRHRACHIVGTYYIFVEQRNVEDEKKETKKVGKN